MFDTSRFRELSRSLPQPLAISVARIARARNIAEQVDATRRAGEVLTRYVAIAAVSSLASTGSSVVDDSLDALPDDGKMLPWGFFLDAAQRVGAVDVDHPLRPVLAASLGSTKGGQRSGLTALQQMVEVRNQMVDHSLAPWTHRKATSLAGPAGLDGLLLQALDRFSGLLSLPLIVFDEQRTERRTNLASVLPFVGELEPFPERVAGRGEVELHEPYLCFRDQLVPLRPGLIWATEEGAYVPSFLFLDAIRPASALYRSVSSDEMVEKEMSESLDPVSWLRGEPQPTDSFDTDDGRSLGSELGFRIRGNGTPDVSGGVDSEVSFGTDAERGGSGGVHDQLAAAGTGPVVDAPGEDQGSGPSPSTRRPAVPMSIEDLHATAQRLGLGTQFDEVLAAARDCGLQCRPFTHGVMVAPPSNGRRFLVWLKIVQVKNPYLKVASSPLAFAEFFDVDADHVKSLLGPDHRVYPGGSTKQFASALRSVFADEPSLGEAESEAGLGQVPESSWRTVSRWRPTGPEGEELDALVRFDEAVDATGAVQLSILFESAGGSAKAGTSRNPDYVACVDLVLRRLGLLDAVLVDAYVDSPRTRGLDPEVRRLHPGEASRLPVHLAEAGDPVAIRKGLLRAMGVFGEHVEGATRSSRRALRLELDGLVGPPVDLSEALRTGWSAGAEPSSDGDRL